MEPPNQVITTTTEPAILGAKTRVLRTVLQVVGALIVAIPVAAKAFNMTEANTAKVTAAMAVLTVVASVLHNLFDAKQATAAKDAGQIGLGLLFRIVALFCFAVFALIAHGTFNSAEGFTWLGAGLVAWVLAELVP